MNDPRAPQEKDLEQGRGDRNNRGKMTKRDWIITIIVAAIILLVGYTVSNWHVITSFFK